MKELKAGAPLSHTVNPGTGTHFTTQSQYQANGREERAAHEGPAGKWGGGEYGLSSRTLPAMSLQALLFCSCKRTVLEASVVQALGNSDPSSPTCGCSPRERSSWGPSHYPDPAQGLERVVQSPQKPSPSQACARTARPPRGVRAT